MFEDEETFVYFNPFLFLHTYRCANKIQIKDIDKLKKVCRTIGNNLFFTITNKYETYSIRSFDYESKCRYFIVPSYLHTCVKANTSQLNCIDNLTKRCPSEQ